MYDLLLRYFVKVMLLVPLAFGMTKKDADLHPGISVFRWEDIKRSFAAITWYALQTFLAL